MRTKRYRITYLLGLIMSLSALIALGGRPVLMAATLSNRLVTIATSAASAQTSHRFDFDIVTAAPLGSIEFEYCSNNPFVGTPCVTPAGLSLSSAVLSAQSGATGFLIDSSSTANKLIISRPVALGAAGPVSYSFDGVVNPSSANQSFFVRLSTYASTDASGQPTDAGGVVFSTSGGLGIGGFVPPFLRSCVGLTVAPDCTAATGNSINLGELTPKSVQAGTSQFAVGTNDVQGYVTYVLGTTMTSGNNIIPALATAVPSQPGTSQFGLNLRANTAPIVGQNPQGAGTGIVQPGYAQANRYAFVSGDAVVASNLPSDYNVFTVSYLVNVASSQPPGVYSTTITYLSVVQF